MAEAAEQEGVYAEAFAHALDMALHRAMTNGDFGALVGQSESAISHYRRGVRTPSVGKAMLIARAAGISLDRIIREASLATPSDGDRDGRREADDLLAAFDAAAEARRVPGRPSRGTGTGR